MFIGCSWTVLEQYGSGLNAGTVCLLRAHTSFLFSTHACEEEEGGSALMQNKAETFTDMCVYQQACVFARRCVCEEQRY